MRLPGRPPQEGNWGAVQAKFAEDGSVQLQNFLKKELAAQVAQVRSQQSRRLHAMMHSAWATPPVPLQAGPAASALQAATTGAALATQQPPRRATALQAVAAADEADRLGRGRVPAYDAGMAGGWQAVGPCHKQRYLRYAPGQGGEGGDGTQAAVGGLLAQIRDELFASAAFARLLTKVRKMGCCLEAPRPRGRCLQPALSRACAPLQALAPTCPGPPRPTSTLPPHLPLSPLAARPARS